MSLSERLINEIKDGIKTNEQTFTLLPRLLENRDSLDDLLYLRRYLDERNHYALEAVINVLCATETASRHSDAFNVGALNPLLLDLSDYLTATTNLLTAEIEDRIANRNGGGKNAN